MDMLDTKKNEYILRDDAQIIGAWADRSEVCISFRPAGPATLKCLDRGAGAKPHSILDKTIKRKASGNEAIDAFFADFENKGTAENLLLGLVGHWSKVMVDDKEKDTVDGIYLTTLGAKTFKTCEGKNKMPYLELDTPKKKNDLISFFKSLYNDPAKAEEVCRELDEQAGKQAEEKTYEQTDGPADVQYYLFTRLFFSGDYDVHDLLQHDKTVATEMDSNLMQELQNALSEGRISQLKRRFSPDDETLKQEESGDYCRVQHGPQFNYTAQMANENFAIIHKAIQDKKDDLEGLNVLVNSVMDMDLPVAMCDGFEEDDKRWGTLTSFGDVAGFYGDRGLTLKSTWRDQAERDKHIIHLIKSVMLVITDYTRQKSDFNPDSDIRKKMDKVLSGYKTMYGDDKYNDFVEKAIAEVF